MKQEVEMDLPFEHCRICGALSPERYDFVNGFGAITNIRCSNERICEKALKAQEALRKEECAKQY